MKKQILSVLVPVLLVTACGHERGDSSHVDTEERLAVQVIESNSNTNVSILPDSSSLLEGILSSMAKLVGVREGDAAFDSYLDIAQSGVIDNSDIVSVRKFPNYSKVRAEAIRDSLVASARLRVNATKDSLKYFSGFDLDKSGVITAGDVGKLRVQLDQLMAIYPTSTFTQINAILSSFRELIGVSNSNPRYTAQLDFDHDGILTVWDARVIAAFPQVNVPDFGVAAHDVLDLILTDARLRIGSTKGMSGYFAGYDLDSNGAITAGDVGKLRQLLTVILATRG